LAIFTTTSYPIHALIEDIDKGKIGLPELQRPFVWPNVNVRNLFDSLYRGYPAGFLLFWETGATIGLKGIGSANEQAVPKLAIVDGQQRLTALYAVLKGAEVLRANFKRERIQIAFNPLTERFDVADAAIRKDKSYIADISAMWKSGTKLISFARNFVKELSATRELSDDDCEKIEDAIGKLYNLPQYQFVALELVSSVGAETIADVFVRINGEGKKLNQSDFIMTLMSVYWDKGRTELENFAHEASRPNPGQASPYNHFIRPSPDQMLRVSIGMALKRARLENVYGILRGRDAKTGTDDPERREEQFALLREGQSAALNLAHWHHFLSALTLAGYRSERMVSSEAAIIFSYVIYLIGICDYRISKDDMRQAIAEFFFMAALTGRYTSSPETRFESDLSLVKDQPNGQAFLDKLKEICARTFTSDYWSITLPSQLATSASRSPSLFAYQAALIKLGATALFSPLKLAEMVDPAVRGPRAAFEQHHLFPRAYLEDIEVKDLKQINQIANFASVEWPENLKIGKKPPSEYVPPLDAKITPKEREDIYFWHALPPAWWELSYDQFLVERRSRMAKVIYIAWQRLTGTEPQENSSSINIAELIASGEGGDIEFKSTLRTNLHTAQVDEKIQLSALKTIVGFLNGKGGTLLIGVADSGEVLGLQADGFTNEDKMGLHLVSLIRDRIGEVFLPYVHQHFDDMDEQRVLAIRCEKGPKPAYLKDGQIHRFYVRGGNSTAELSGSSIIEYVNARFR
jgi:hypothetical protein